MIYEKDVNIERIENGYEVRAGGYETKENGDRTWHSKKWMFADIEDAFKKTKELIGE